MPRSFIAAVIVISGLILVAPSLTMADSLRAELEARIKAVSENDEVRVQVIEQGRERALFCANCHGKDGNSEKPFVPNLAAQNGIYLLQQIDNFASGKRQDYSTVMQQLTSIMSDEEKLALSIYYASVPLKPNRETFNTDMLALGKTIYTSRCAGCHGNTGDGQRDFARIGGQQYVYLKQVLTNFRDGDSNRTSPTMEAMIQGYSDKDIDAVSSYLSQLIP
ncbi:MAG: c-type cytochrome [Gammaproteobacteria bacterium]|nr:c-type cytochrome [Gammaproteobacteria bacterium]